jgi:hypothetical protein
MGKGRRTRALLLHARDARAQIVRVLNQEAARFLREATERCSGTRDHKLLLALELLCPRSLLALRVANALRSGNIHVPRDLGFFAVQAEAGRRSGDKQEIRSPFPPDLLNSCDYSTIVKRALRDCSSAPVRSRSLSS